MAAQSVPNEIEIWPPTQSSKWVLPRSSSPRLNSMPNYVMARPTNAKYKVAFPEQKHSCITFSVTYRDVTLIDIDQWYATNAGCNWHQLCHPQVVTGSAICNSQTQRMDRNLPALFNAKTGSMWWSTISPTVYPSQCGWWFMPQINFMNQMLNWITCWRINDSQFQFHYNPESPLNATSNAEIEGTLRQSHNCNGQFIWWERHRWSN